MPTDNRRFHAVRTLRGATVLNVTPKPHMDNAERASRA
jgi:hypothetical protein